MKLRRSEVKESSDRISNSNRAERLAHGLKTGWVGAKDVSALSRNAIHVQPGFDWAAADGYLFDIDGTLLNSRDEVHYRAFHDAVAEVFGLDLRVDGVPVHGNTDIGILRAYLDTVPIPEKEWQPRVPEVVEFMGAHVERNAIDLRPELCPSVLALIQRLSAQGKLLGVASGNVERVGWAKLRACGLRDYFSLGAFSGTLEKREDIIAHGIQQARELRGKITTMCLVGDTPSDIRSAHANKIPAIAVATGIYSVEELLAHDPEVCVSSCDDLLRN